MVQIITKANDINSAIDAINNDGGEATLIDGDNAYWSSSSYDDTNAYSVSSSNTDGYSTKTDILRVRAVKSITLTL